MNFEITLERVSPFSDSDEALIQEMEQKSRITAIQKSNRIPSLTEVLWHMSEEEMLDIKDLLGDALATD